MMVWKRALRWVLVCVWGALFALLLLACGSGDSDNRAGSAISWTHPIDQSDNISPDGEDVITPQVAMNAFGDTIVVWTQNVGSIDHIFMSEYRNNAWHHPVDLNDNISPDGEDAWRPQVTMNAAGDAVVVWQQGDGSNSQIFMSEYRNNAWYHPVNLSDNISPDGGAAVFPQVAMDAVGNTIVVWNQYFGAGSQICMSEYRNNAWHHPADLSDSISPVGLSTVYPQVAMDAVGNTIIVWQQGSVLNNQIFMSEYRNSAWHHPVDLSESISPDGQSAAYPQVAMDSTGNAIVVWLQGDGSNDQVFMSEYRNSDWHHPVDLSDNISLAGGDAVRPQIAMDSAGNAIAVWEQRDASNNQIFMSEYRNSNWRHPADLSDAISMDDQYASAPQVALDVVGTAVVVWTQSYGFISYIFMREYRNGDWYHPVNLSENISPNGKGAGAPQVAMHAADNAVVVWSQDDGENYQLFMSEYR